MFYLGGGGGGGGIRGVCSSSANYRIFDFFGARKTWLRLFFGFRQRNEGNFMRGDGG